MEVVFTENTKDLFEQNKITGFYGDVIDLMERDIDIDGIIYDDEWTVRRLLNGIRLKLNKRIEGILNYLEIDSKLLNKKLKDLSQKDFKFILLAKLLLDNKNIIIFDYFDVGLTYKDKKKLAKIIRTLKRDGKTIIIISKDVVFLNTIVDSICVVKDREIVYNGLISGYVNSEFVPEIEIIKFIKAANKKKAKLDFTLDSKELLKDIYRSVY